MHGSRKRGLSLGPYLSEVETIRQGLIDHGSLCEFMRKCTAQAEFVVTTKHQVAYLCHGHYELVRSQEQLRLHLESHLWDLFQLTFNFIRQNNESLGDLLASVKEKERVATRDARTTQRSIAQARRDFNQWLAEVAIKPGTPDDSVLEARGLPTANSKPPPVGNQGTWLALDRIL